MKNIGKIFATVCFALAASTAAYAQDLNQATELFNQAAMALKEDNNTAALEFMEQALTMAESLGEEGAALTAEAKKFIPQILFQISKDEASDKNFDAALENLAEAEAKAKEFGNEEIMDNINGLFSQVYMGKANAALNAKTFEEAAALYQKASEYDPTNATAFIRMGMSLSRIGKEDEAVAAYEQASALGETEKANKQLVKMFQMKANKALKAKQMEEAMEAIEKALVYNPEDPQSNMLLGTIAFAKQDFAKAAQGFEKVLSLNPEHQNKNTIIYQLAVAYESLGQNAKAKSYYQQIVGDANFGEFAKHKVSQL